VTERGEVIRSAVTAYLGTDHDTTAYVEQGTLVEIIERALAANEKRRRLFSFKTASDGRHSVTCLNCGWSRTLRRKDPQVVFDLSNAHECPGVETYAEAEARLDAGDAIELEAFGFRTTQVGGGLNPAILLPLALNEADRAILADPEGMLQRLIDSGAFENFVDAVFEELGGPAEECQS